MDAFFNFLGSSGQTILGIVIGGVIVLVGQAFNSRSATRSATMAVEASRESTDANLEIARNMARMQMKMALLASTLDAYEAFHSRMTEWYTSMRDEFTLGHGEMSRDKYAGWILAEDWAATALLAKLTAVGTGQLPAQAAAVYSAGLKALSAHERNFHTAKENNQGEKRDTEQSRISALESFRVHLEGLPKQLREYLEIDQPQY